MKDKAAALEYMRQMRTQHEQRLAHELKMVEMFPETSWATDMHKSAAYTQLFAEHYADAIEALESEG